MKMCLEKKQHLKMVTTYVLLVLLLSPIVFGIVYTGVMAGGF